MRQPHGFRTAAAEPRALPFPTMKGCKRLPRRWQLAPRMVHPALPLCSSMLSSAYVLLVQRRRQMLPLPAPVLRAGAPPRQCRAPAPTWAESMTATIMFSSSPLRRVSSGNWKSCKQSRGSGEEPREKQTCSLERSRGRDRPCPRTMQLPHIHALQSAELDVVPAQTRS